PFRGHRSAVGLVQVEPLAGMPSHLWRDGDSFRQRGDKRPITRRLTGGRLPALQQPGQGGDRSAERRDDALNGPPMALGCARDLFDEPDRRLQLSERWADVLWGEHTILA